ncbi:MAG: DegT/DnrJ/EryC1/StrS family aminotransferase [Candidatus Omnitrophica bacterium]|nr:DegT/DnrJ/EryC1/StrS family aminotransferase [Candidatus Omnitrophota bacterium]
MKIPIFDIKAQTAPIKKLINKAIGRVINSGAFILGDEVSKIEQKIAAYCRVKYAIGVSNGTDAILLSLKALGIEEGDGVICPAFTYYATAGAIARSGAVPFFADIDPRTYNISIDSAKNILKRGKKIKAIIPVHLYGQCADMDEIIALAKKYNLKVIEDAAQAFGAIYKGQKSGSFGDAGSVSFFPAKNLGAFGDAGCVLTNKAAVTEKMRILRNQGASHKNKYKHIMIGYNARLDTIQAAVLSVKLDVLNKWNKKRRDNAEYYNRKLESTNLVTPYVPSYNKHIYHQYVLRARGKKEKIVKHLLLKGIDARTYYPIPLHLQPCFKYLGYKKGAFPESERCSRETFAIPVYPELKKQQMDYIVKTIKEAIA